MCHINQAIDTALRLCFNIRMVLRGNGYLIQWNKKFRFCIPCLFFTDPGLRGEPIRFNQGNAFTNGGFHSWKKQHNSILRFNQGNAFTNGGFRSWKKQHNSILRHEDSTIHRNAVFSKEQSIKHCLNEQSKADLERKKTRLLKTE